MKTFIIDLLDELKDVFRNEGIEMIEKTRTVTDWNGLVLKIKERSIPVLFSLEKEMLVACCKESLLKCQKCC